MSSFLIFSKILLTYASHKKETLFRTSLSLVPKSLKVMTWVITQNQLRLMCLYVCILYCDMFNGVKMPGTLLSHGWTVYWIILVLARCTYQEYHLDVSMEIQIQDHVLKPLVFFFYYESKFWDLFMLKHKWLTRAILKYLYIN